jgi:hypothetical protein
MMSRALAIRGFLTVLAAFILLAGCRQLDTGPGEGPLSVFPRPSRTLGDLGERGIAKTDFQLPPSVTVCGEALPLDRPSVRERLDYEFLFAVNHPAQVELWRRRALRFFPLIESSLKKAGLPDDLKYLAVAESDLRPQVVSPAGAAGIWQFIPSTARMFGLRVNKFEDQRMLPEILLPIGMKYLSSLRNRFGSWSLAMAAYNAGEQRISNALSSQKATDYYGLNLPRETERYVYRIAAIKLVLDSAELYGLNDSPPAGLYKFREYNESSASFPKETGWDELARKHKTDYKTLRLLNPHLASQSSLKGGPYIFRVPRG